jgi:hypothetical protein
MGKCNSEGVTRGLITIRSKHQGGECGHCRAVHQKLYPQG